MLLSKLSARQNGTPKRKPSGGSGAASGAESLLRRFIPAVLLVVCCFALQYFPLLTKPDFAVKDVFYANRRQTSPQIKIIAIDEKTIQKLGPFGTWDRSKMASLLDRLDRDKDNEPAVIVLDVLMTGHMSKEGDSQLSSIIRKSGNVVAASHLVIGKNVTVSGGSLAVNSGATMLELPYWVHAPDTSTGFANTVLQPDGTVRTALLSSDFQGKTVHSLAYQAYLDFCKSTNRAPITPKTDKNTFIIDYAGQSGDYETVSMADVMDGKISPLAFKGCAVFIGAYTSGLQDSFYVNSTHASLYGVEIHANIFQNLLEGREVLPLDTWWTALLAALLALGYYLLARRRGLLFCSILAPVMIAAWLAACTLVFHAGYALPVVCLPLFVLCLYAARFLRAYLSEWRYRRKLSGAFKKYVAPQVFDQLAKDRNFEIRLGGELRHIAVLFIDIRGFTSMSESLPPQTVVSILNEYFELVTKAIFQNGGTLDKFIGDAAMALFNAPADLPDYLYKAVLAGLDIREGTEELQNKLNAQFGRTIGFGIGLHCGEAVVGNIGSDFRMDYTAIGDTVNTTSRIEGSAKAGQILVSQTMYEQLKDRVTAEKIGALSLKGKEKPISVYNIIGKG